MPELVFHKGFRSDALRAKRWMDENRSPSYVARFERELDRCLSEIELNPCCSHFDITGRRRYNLKKFPYAVVYEELALGTCIFILRHHSQSPDYGNNRSL